MNKEAKTVVVKSSTGKTTETSIEIAHIPAVKRIIKSTLLLFTFLIIASISAFIPLLHLILPPAFLILGVVVAIKNFRNSLLINTSRAVCPECSNAFKINARTYQASFAEICENCGRENRLCIKSI